MNHPLVLVVDAAAVLAASPEARALVTELLRTSRRNGLAVRTEDRRPLTQYPTAAALEAAADRQQ
ncbi:hypothetical protein [Streptomyces sp. PsTaAH-124]|uniref:hypothetical protein n=1 Tax=Streptomyces sp. PsTaAH-124 TaxID=1157638 RepID=UPI00035F8FD8|nr:hypothetical protein [Streptomyces sp. PsTaAH-124]